MKVFICIGTVTIMALFLWLPIIGCAQQAKKEKIPSKKAKNKIVRVGEMQPLFVSEILDVEIPTIKQEIFDMFDESRKQQGTSLDYLEPYPRENQMFPSDARMEDFVEDNAPLTRYLKLDPLLRKQDVYLYNIDNGYWNTAEYHCRGQTAKFQTHFIVHLEVQSPKRTKVEVIQFQPNIWCGKEFYEGRHGLGWYDNIVPVSPTASDSRDLLQAIRIAIKNKQAR